MVLRVQSGLLLDETNKTWRKEGDQKSTEMQKERSEKKDKGGGLVKRTGDGWKRGRQGKWEGGGEYEGENIKRGTHRSERKGENLGGGELIRKKRKDFKNQFERIIIIQ